MHRLVYALEYSPDGTDRGYVNYTLSYFNVSDFSDDTVYADTEGTYENVTICRCFTRRHFFRIVNERIFCLCHLYIQRCSLHMYKSCIYMFV